MVHDEQFGEKNITTIIMQSITSQNNRNRNFMIKENKKALVNAQLLNTDFQSIYVPFSLQNICAVLFKNVYENRLNETVLDYSYVPFCPVFHQKLCGCPYVMDIIF